MNVRNIWDDRMRFIEDEYAAPKKQSAAIFSVTARLYAIHVSSSASERVFRS